MTACNIRDTYRATIDFTPNRLSISLPHPLQPGLLDLRPDIHPVKRATAAVHVSSHRPCGPWPAGRLRSCSALVGTADAGNLQYPGHRHALCSSAGFTGASLRVCLCLGFHRYRRSRRLMCLDVGGSFHRHGGLFGFRFSYKVQLRARFLPWLISREGAQAGLSGGSIGAVSRLAAVE